MNLLHRQAWDRAREFLRKSARPLEWALFRNRFERGPVEDVFDALRVFQNADGGFGRILEPDLRTPDSSALGKNDA